MITANDAHGVTTIRNQELNQPAVPAGTPGCQLRDKSRGGLPRAPGRVILMIILGFMAALPGPAWSYTTEPASRMEETMLIFVGENLEVLEIASRRVESPHKAPAVARVVTQKQIREQGLTTLKEVLETLPGFHMAQKERGTQPYLRGIPDSILFLYDTVPMGSDISKSYHSLDHELSLSAIKRVETVRGPGSVLWGPDAFAGIVNVVPLTGKDVKGVETGVLLGAPDEQRGFFINGGHYRGGWDFFGTVSGREGEVEDRHYNLIRFWGDGKTPTPPADRLGSATLGPARYLEGFARAAFRDSVVISGRISDSDTPYTMRDRSGGRIWSENRKTDTGYVRLETKVPVATDTVVRLNGVHYWFNPHLTVIERELQQEEKTYYGEMLLEQAVFGDDGFFSGGVSYREKKIDDAPIWDGFLLDFLNPDNESFVPIITEQDYTTRLWSFFAQYNHRFGDFNLWLGLRNDNHDAYRDNLSHNAGVIWTPVENWVIKLLYGTAYRTPFARQLREDDKPELEKISSVNFQVAWQPSKRTGVSLTAFSSRIDDHINEDPFAGLSLPNHQNIMGLEFSSKYSPHPTLDLGLNFTLLDNSGPQETYKYNFEVTIGDDGKPVKHFVDLSYPFDAGPDRLLNLTGTWRLADGVSTFLRLGYVSSRDLIFPVVSLEEDPLVTFSGYWQLDGALTVKAFPFSWSELSVSVKNLLDNDYDTPGSYSAIDGQPLRFEIVLRMRR